MLKNLRKRKEQERNEAKGKKGIFTVLPASILLADERYEPSLKQLKNLCSVTQTDYEIYYLPPLENYAAFVQRLPAAGSAQYHQTGGMLSQTLDLVITSLKLRQGYMLPPGSDAETCYREQEYWTYAIFLAALCQDLWQIPCFFEIELWQSNRFFMVWQSFTGMPMPQEMNYRIKLIENPNESETKLFNALLVNPLLPAHCFHYFSDYKIAAKNCLSHIYHVSQSYNPISDIVIKAQEMVLRKSETSLVIPEKTEELLSQPSSSKIDSSAISQEFIYWLKEILHDNVLRINEEGSIIYRLPEGIFALMPMIVDIFSRRALRAGKKTSASEKNKIQYFFNNIKDNPMFIFNEITQSYLHDYCLLDNEKIKYQGLIIKVEALYSKEESLPKIKKHFQTMGKKEK